MKTSSRGKFNPKELVSLHTASLSADYATDATDATKETPFDSLYDRAVEDLLDISVGDEWVETSAGRTHVLVAGDPSAQPVVVLQGGNVTNPVTLAWFQALADDYYLVAPDTPGQPGKSTQESPPEYGQWVGDVLDGLGIDRAAMIGASHGAGILLEAAAHDPDRITTGALVVPAGFGTPLSLGLVRIVAPSLLYRLLPREGILARALAPMFTQPVGTVDDVVVETVGLALRTSDLQAEFPGPDDSDALAGFDAPALVVLGENDPFFPARRTRQRAASDLPGLVDCLTLAGERHFLSPVGQQQATERIRTFLAEQDAPDGR